MNDLRNRIVKIALDVVCLSVGEFDTRWFEKITLVHRLPTIKRSNRKRSNSKRSNSKRSNSKRSNRKRLNSKRSSVRWYFELMCPSFAVGIPVLTLYVSGKSYRRGFYCDDESIRYPFKESTVTSTVLYLYGVFIPTIVVSIASVHCTVRVSGF